MLSLNHAVFLLYLILVFTSCILSKHFDLQIAGTNIITSWMASLANYRPYYRKVGCTNYAKNIRLKIKVSLAKLLSIFKLNFSAFCNLLLKFSGSQKLRYKNTWSFEDHTETAKNWKLLLKNKCLITLFVTTFGTKSYESHLNLRSSKILVSTLASAKSAKMLLWKMSYGKFYGTAWIGKYLKFIPKWNNKFFLVSCTFNNGVTF